MSVLSIMPFDTEMSDSALEQVADILRPAFEAMYDAVDVLEPLEQRAEGHILGVMPSGNLLMNVDVFDHLDLVDLLSESNTLVITDRHLIPEEFYEFGKGRYNPLYGCAEG
ncbi:hypothetical protein KY362_06005, partial [Candidatus Woesearchaeota archaeon]|nr:hypothetical protein [Candidatus Woesearchaeota archaeon]